MQELPYTEQEMQIYKRVNDCKAQRRHRAKKGQPKPPTFAHPFEEFSSKWLKNEEKLARENPELLARYQESHEFISMVQDELLNTRRYVGIYTYPWGPVKPCPDDLPTPDQIFIDIKKDIEEHGTLNYCEVEAKCTSPGNFKGELISAEERVYQDFGFRLRFSQEDLQNSRECLLIYALTTRDQNLDWLSVEESIDEAFVNYPIYRDPDRLRALIAAYRGAK